MRQLLSISVDLDETPHYRALHGLAPREGDEVWARALPRLAEWARQRGVPVTWFVVGRDLHDQRNAAAAQRLASAGHELGCHSFSHDYHLTRRAFAEMRNEVESGILAVERATGVRVRGFRAPGYAVSDTLLELLRECGLLYDSSVFPCPGYYAGKVAAVLGMRARGRKSLAMLADPEGLRAPRTPYRVGRPYWRRGRGIVEIPIQVTPSVRLPVIGTSLALAGTTGARLLARRVAREETVNLELHGLDALDLRDGLQDLAPYQLDLNRNWNAKLDAIDAAVSYLLGVGFRAVCLEAMAARWGDG